MAILTVRAHVNRSFIRTEYVLMMSVRHHESKCSLWTNHEYPGQVLTAEDQERVAELLGR